MENEELTRTERQPTTFTGKGTSVKGWCTEKQKQKPPALGLYNCSEVNTSFNLMGFPVFCISYYCLPYFKVKITERFNHLSLKEHEKYVFKASCSL